LAKIHELIRSFNQVIRASKMKMKMKERRWRLRSWCNRWRRWKLWACWWCTNRTSKSRRFRFQWTWHFRGFQ